MTEQELIDLGFERNDDYEGGDHYYYYTYDLSKEDNNFCLISAANDEPGWWVEFFNFDTIRFTDVNELKLFIDIIKRNTFTKPTRIANDNINVTNK
jgi:hypothetical protein